jgi:hypothetical protein
MPATVSQVATGLQTRLATIGGLRAFTYQPEQLNPPTAYPVLNSVTYHRAFAGGDVEMFWSIYVVVGRYTDRRAFDNIDDFLAYDGVKSIRAAIEGDRTLGGVCNTLVVSSSFAIEPQTQADAEFLTVRVDLTVHA